MAVLEELAMLIHMQLVSPQQRLHQLPPILLVIAHRHLVHDRHAVVDRLEGGEPLLILLGIDLIVIQA